MDLRENRGRRWPQGAQGPPGAHTRGTQDGKTVSSWRDTASGLRDAGTGAQP